MIDQDDKLSLFTYTLFMNTTALNIGDHCIVAVNAAAVARPPVDFGNQALLADAERCETFDNLQQVTYQPSYMAVRGNRG